MYEALRFALPSNRGSERHVTLILVLSGVLEKALSGRIEFRKGHYG
jgi:hypothetical protein